MRKIVFDFVLFGIIPLSITVVCGLGVLGGITDTEALVPAYLIGLIFAITAIGMYCFAALFKAIRWAATAIRSLTT